MSTPRELANAIRALSMDAVQRANSGHPGMPMGMADIAQVLWRTFMRYNPANPQWFDRDRFVLSNGHGSMLLYSVLHLTGYPLTIEDIKGFRQLGSRTPGHPEYDLPLGIETTTGPLGQGLANAVGMALAERVLALQFNRPGFKVIDHYTYAFCGDGCLMEGVSHEACSFAGTLKLGKLIVLYDDNGISIDGKVAGWFTDKTPERFAAYGWHVLPDVDGLDAAAVEKALRAAREETSRPSLICCKTIIGFGAPDKQGTKEAHGEALGAEEVTAARQTLGWRYPPFEVPSDIEASWDHALPSAHGVVVQPIADDITAELGADKITIGRPEGLSLSATALGQQQVAVNFRAFTFDTQVWGFDRDAPFNARQSELIGLAASAPVSKRRQARFNLARFYLAKDMAPEAKAVLNVALSDQRGSDDITGSVLTAVADVMLDRPENALKELSKPQVGNQQDAPIWRAIALARQGRWAEAQDIFRKVGAAMGALPIELQRMAMKEALRSSIEVRDFNNATRVVNDFETVGVTPDLEPTINVLLGRLYEGLGRTEDALASYRATATSNDRRAAAQGRLRETVLAFATGSMGRKDVINDIETLTTVWRGDETETEGLKLLAHLYTEDSRYRDAFHVMRTALLAHPNSDMTRKIQDEAATTFDSLFLGGKGDALPPVEALGLFYDFRELTPIGRRGDEMIRRLSDRLVGVDLLDQAAELLQHQVDHRLQGAARAQVATRLAVVYLLNRKPDRALATLQATRVAELSNDMRDQRLLLESRATSTLGRHDLALELIGNINSREASRLRSDILWAARRWREAGEQIELLYGDRWRQFAPLNDTERSDILRAAIGYALGEEFDRPGASARKIPSEIRRRSGPSRFRCGERADRYQRHRVPGHCQESRERRYAGRVLARFTHALSGCGRSFARRCGGRGRFCHTCVG